MKRSISTRLRMAFSNKFVAVSLFALVVSVLARFAVLNADAPASLSWSGDLLTDEGWYSNSAVRVFNLGLPFIEGDFNPAAVMPFGQMWRYLFFLIFGLSLESARASTATASVLSIVLVFLLILLGSRSKIAAILGALGLATSHSYFFYSRLAFNEILGTSLILGSFLSLYILIAHQGLGKKALATRQSKHTTPLCMFIGGLLLSLAVLTKTTFVACVPILGLYALFTCAVLKRYQLIIVALAGFSLPVAIHAWVITSYNLFADLSFFSSINLSGRIGSRNLLEIPLNMARFIYTFFRSEGTSMVLLASFFTIDVICFLSLLRQKPVSRLPMHRRIWMDIVNPNTNVISMSLKIAILASIVSMSALIILGGSYMPFRYFSVFPPFVYAYVGLCIGTLVFKYRGSLSNPCTGSIASRFEVAGLRPIITFVLLLVISASAFRVFSSITNLTFTKVDSYSAILRSIDKAYPSVNEPMLLPVVLGEVADDLALFAGRSKVYPVNLGMSESSSSDYLYKVKPDFYLSSRVIESSKPSTFACNDLDVSEADGISKICHAGANSVSVADTFNPYPFVYPTKSVFLFRILW